MSRQKTRPMPTLRMATFLASMRTIAMLVSLPTSAMRRKTTRLVPGIQDTIMITSEIRFTLFPSAAVSAWQ
ncbi:hypothetical protein CKO51_12705 [Rhodopirellula sp. SM50]|nr:hypothetical protein CKO51_12705 [Rhodopirellula sp. SM50]